MPTYIVVGCTFGDVRLVDGPTPNQGRLELCNNSQWGSVCDTYWEEYNSRVVCRQLGYDVAGQCLFLHSFFLSHFFYFLQKTLYYSSNSTGYFVKND